MKTIKKQTKQGVLLNKLKPIYLTKIFRDKMVLVHLFLHIVFEINFNKKYLLAAIRISMKVYFKHISKKYALKRGIRGY